MVVITQLIRSAGTVNTGGGGGGVGEPGGCGGAGVQV